MADPGKDLADYLDTQSTAVTLGTNLWYGPVRAVSSDVPVEAVFCLAWGGGPPARTLGVATEVRKTSVQVRVRSNAYASGYSLAQTVQTKLHSATPSGYLDVQAQQPEPVFLEQDKNLYYHWALNFLVVYVSV